MGTETGDFLVIPYRSAYGLVKLNNPLMGTETVLAPRTIHKLYYPC